MDQAKYDDRNLISIEDLQKYGKQVKKLIKSNERLLRQWHYREVRLLKLEKLILSQGDFDQVAPIIETWFSTQNYSYSISFSPLYQNAIYLDGVQLSTDLNFTSADPIDLFTFIFLISIIKNYLTLFKVRPFGNAEIYELAFQHMNYPMALIDSKENVTLHTQKFSSLNVPIKECLKYPSGHKFLLPQGLFQMTKRELQDGHVVFFRENTMQTRAGQDLGIVTSSLAHELNNPIAGILAALGLLELAEEESSEFFDEIAEMKRACWRCKELIDLFLGFSKANPENIQGEDYSFESIVQHAIGLVRFRLIEMNLSMNVEVKQNKRLEEHFNSSVLTMIVYLVFGEVLTEFNHFLLVSSKSKAEIKRVEIQVIEDVNFFQIEMMKEVAVSKNWRNFHLIQSLMDYEGMSLVVDTKNNKLKFCWT